MAKKAKAKTRPAAPKLSFNERVRKVIHGEAETKEKVVNIFDNSSIYGSGLDATNPAQIKGLTQTNLLGVIGIAQGTEQEQREGNKIQDCRLRVRGFIQSQAYDSNNTSDYPYEVHMVFFKQKKNIANSNIELKQLPNNATGAVDGTIQNTLYPFNKDMYIIRKVRVFKLRPLAHLRNDAGITTALNTQQSNAPAFIRFVETIDIHKELKFNDGEDTPTNDWCGVSLFVINGDGIVLDFTQVRAKAYMDAVLRYKDL